jgi:hypothetical protein
MMGRREDRQGQFFYSFDLAEVVPPDHLVRQIDAALDLSWVHKELAPYYSHTGRPSIDPVLMIRMLIVGYVFAIRSERRLCSEVQVPTREVSHLRAANNLNQVERPRCIDPDSPGTQPKPHTRSGAYLYGFLFRARVGRKPP